MTTSHPTNDAVARARGRLIVALDVGGEPAALRLVERLAGEVGIFKIGLELFTLAGPGIVARVRAAGGGAGIFLDLKFHDIPNTVERAVRAATSLGVEMLTLHASGGGEMLRAAVRGSAGGEAPAAGRPLLLGVTVLTSSNAGTLRELGLEAPTENAVATQVVRLARLAQGAGLGGLVASPLEIDPLRAAVGPSLRLVIPGVRPIWAAEAGDQRRVLTPSEAVAAGADFLVVGRPITGATDPVEAARRVVEEIVQGAGAGGR
ncbi:MAG: orotidine-5'-phosphate decarboxylase [Verrucomicrobia bacterium]|nr:orotidine-5'-phosphate decarboxylase [Verrucomicrobiota bacterium]MBV9659117.1 orotidine-5'-phosphate decarboxylase [Verrucomicrobiota bacterium]